MEEQVLHGEGGQAPSRDTVAALFQRAVHVNGAAPLVFFDDGSFLSYTEAGSLAFEIAGRLQAKGIGKGSYVVSASAASAEAALVFWASMLVGAVFVPVDGNMQPEKLSRILELIDPGIVFTGPEWAGKSALAGLKPVIYTSSATTPVAGGSQQFQQFFDGGEGAYSPQPVSPEDAAVVLFTSGTSGEPKGIVLSQGALSGSGRLMAETYQWGPSDKVLMTGDFHTMSGLRNPCVAALYSGASFIIAPQGARGSAPACSELMERLGVTILCTVPAFLSQFTRFQEKISGGFARSLRFVMCTGTNLSPAVIDEFEGRYGKSVLNYYGLTETAGLCVGVPPGMEQKLKGAVGVPLGCSLKIAAPEGAEAGEGISGELLISTENIMSGYLKDPEATEKAFAGGWFLTRDLCRRWPDGSIELLGRVDDAFKDLRGELVHPSEIEKVIEGLPNVLEAVVCGFGERDGRPAAAAFVVAKEKAADEDILAGELRRQVFAALGPYRTPALIIFVDSLPRGTNGKVLRRKLMETLP
ncbi:fatty-acyl-CoA synthase [uncultured bacterium]|nr:fatty-acyl-CoA synthase [uncultured bacterium]